MNLSALYILNIDFSIMIMTFIRAGLLNLIRYKVKAGCYKHFSSAQKETAVFFFYKSKYNPLTDVITVPLIILYIQILITICY